MSKRRLHGNAGKNLVGFEVAAVTYALEIARVREILRPLPTLSLPHVPDTVVGVVDHRGDVIPILDLRLRFGVPADARERARDRRWIIVNRGDRPVGLIVDRVTEVFGLEEASERELPQLAAGEKMRGFKAAYAHRGQLVFVLDVDTLTDVADAIALPDLADVQAGVTSE